MRSFLVHIGTGSAKILKDVMYGVHAGNALRHGLSLAPVPARRRA